MEQQDDPFEEASSHLGSAAPFPPPASSSSSSQEPPLPSPPGSDNVSSLLTCAFNQDGGCLAVGTTQGFSVHNLHPQYAVSVSRQLQGGIGIVEMLFRCNLMAIVGGGGAPHSPPHRVLIWDDHIAREIGELSFKQAVLRVRLRKDTIAVALRDRVYVYHLADLSLRDKIYTADNPDGLLCLSTQIQDMVLACPSVTTGHVRVELYGMRKTVSLSSLRQLMEAHESALRSIALTADGSKLATASVKGTVIRVWDVPSASCLQEFRRGVERATITCMAWSWDDAWLSCASDKGTAHVFQVTAAATATATAAAEGPGEKKPDSSAPQPPPSSGAGSSLTRMFFSTVRKSVEGDAKKSVCQVRGVPHPHACAFVSDATRTLAVAGWDADGNGVLLLSEFAPGEEPRRVGYHVLCRSAVADASEEVRRRRRMRGWTPEIPQTPEGGRLYVGERLEVLEKGMEQIHFEDKDEFVSVTAVRPPPVAAAKPDAPSSKAAAKSGAPPATADQVGSEGDSSLSQNEEEAAGRSNLASTVGDSVRTEPLDDDCDFSDHNQ